MPVSVRTNRSEFDRALRLASGPLVILAALVSAPTWAKSTPYDVINASAAASPITAQRLRGGLTMLEGSGGNITVLKAGDEAFLVDAGIGVSRAKIEEALRRLGVQRIRALVSTHWHWDHTDGNGWVRAAGAQVYASRNVIKRLSGTVRVEEWGHTFGPVAPSSRPNHPLSDRTVLPFGPERIEIRSYRPGHTDGDVSAYFKRADVLSTGDTFWNGMYPFIDHSTGGSIDGAILAANVNLALAGRRTIVVPGHGPLGDRNQLVAFRDMLVTVRSRVARLKARGKSLPAVLAARPTQDLDARWGKGLIDGRLFTSLVYLGV